MNGEKVAERKSDETRAKIFDFAMAFVEQQGVDQLTMRRLAERAAVSPALIIQYFGSKAQLLNLIYDAKNQRVMDLLNSGEASLDGDTTEDVLTNVISLLLERDMAQPELTLAVMANAFHWTEQEEAAFTERLEPFFEFMIAALRKVTPKLSYEEARASSVLMLMAYTQAIRIILKRGSDKASALSWMHMHVRLIAGGIRSL